MLALAGVGTWALVTWLALSQSLTQFELLLSGMGHLTFLILFLLISTHFLSRFNPKVITGVVYSQALVTLILIVFDSNMITPILLVIWASRQTEGDPLLSSNPALAGPYPMAITPEHRGSQALRNGVRPWTISWR